MYFYTYAYIVCVDDAYSLVWTSYTLNSNLSQIWNAFVWFPISPFSNEAQKSGAAHACEYKPTELNKTVCKITYFFRIAIPNASSGLSCSLICVTVVRRRHIKVAL